MVSQPPVPPRLAAAAWALAMDTASGAACTRLAAEGIPAILLKGPALAAWLYPGELRHSRDIDLLVSPGEFQQAQDVLAGLGYRARLSGAPECEIGPNSLLLFSPSGVCIDLHHHLIGSADPPERCWQVLSRHTVEFRLASGVGVQVLDPPARTMHLALHAAQDGPAGTKALGDLERGVASLPFDLWREAAVVAEELGATSAFAAGLRLSPGGVRIAADLDLPETLTVELVLRTSSAPAESLFFARLAAAPGAWAKLGMIARKVWPTAAFMRANSLDAQRGRVALLRARLERVASLPGRAAPALRAWLAARERAGRSRITG